MRPSPTRAHGRDLGLSRHFRGNAGIIALISKSWVPSSRRHPFHTIILTPKDIVRWLKTFPVPENSLAHHVRVLSFSPGGYYDAPQELSEHAPWFTNVRRVELSRDPTFQPSQASLSGIRLPQSITSLVIGTDSPSCISGILWLSYRTWTICDCARTSLRRWLGIISSCRGLEQP